MPAQARRVGQRVSRVLRTAAFGLSGVLWLVPLTLLAVLGEARASRRIGAAAAGLLAAGSLAAAFAAARGGLAPRLVGLAVLASAAWVCVGKLPAPPEPTLASSAAGLCSRFAGGRHPRRRGLLHFIPEADQVRLVCQVGTRLAPFPTLAHARRIREVSARLGREIQEDPRAGPPGAATDLAFDALLGRPHEFGHYFAYVPSTAPGERLGALLFLHGDGGNFKLLAWAWRTFAEARRFAILCPTFGFGLWGRGGADAVEEVLADASARFPLDPSRTYLGGLSDGGLGVTRSATVRPSLYRGLIYVSATMRTDELADPRFVQGWRGRPVLVLQGDRDWNVSRASVDRAVAALQAQGIAVDYRVFPGEDHFLFFARRDELADAVWDWMAGARAAGGR